MKLEQQKEQSSQKRQLPERTSVQGEKRSVTTFIWAHCLWRTRERTLEQGGSVSKGSREKSMDPTAVVRLPAVKAEPVTRVAAVTELRGRSLVWRRSGGSLTALQWSVLPLASVGRAEVAKIVLSIAEDVRLRERQCVSVGHNIAGLVLQLTS